MPEIGQRVRVIRRRRGLGLNEAAGLAGISKPYLSLLERGQRWFERRGLLEDLAKALGCSVAVTVEDFVRALLVIAAAASMVVPLASGFHRG